MTEENFAQAIASNLDISSVPIPTSLNIIMLI